MNKITLADVAANAAGIKKKDAEVAVNAIFAAMANELASGGKVQIAGFGNFKMKERVERVGRKGTDRISRVSPGRTPSAGRRARLKTK